MGIGDDDDSNDDEKSSECDRDEAECDDAPLWDCEKKINKCTEKKEEKEAEKKREKLWKDVEIKEDKKDKIGQRAKEAALAAWSRGGMKGGSRGLAELVLEKEKKYKDDYVKRQD